MSEEKRYIATSVLEEVIKKNIFCRVQRVPLEGETEPSAFVITAPNVTVSSYSYRDEDIVIKVDKNESPTDTIALGTKTRVSSPDSLDVLLVIPYNLFKEGTNDIIDTCKAGVRWLNNLDKFGLTPNDISSLFTKTNQLLHKQELEKPRCIITNVLRNYIRERGSSYVIQRMRPSDSDLKSFFLLVEPDRVYYSYYIDNNNEPVVQTHPYNTEIKLKDVPFYLPENAFINEKMTIIDMHTYSEDEWLAIFSKIGLTKDDIDNLITESIDYANKNGIDIDMAITKREYAKILEKRRTKEFNQQGIKKDNQKYSIEVVLLESKEDNKHKPYFWVLYKIQENGIKTNDGSGWAETPEKAWQEAYDFYTAFKK